MAIVSLGFETRPFYGRLRYYRKIRFSKIFLVGRCNFRCVYCKRNGTFVDSKGNIINSMDVTVDDIKRYIDSIDPRTEMFRISGGDPIMLPNAIFVKLMAYAQKRGIITSIATNMSIPQKIRFMAKYVDYIAGDFKAPLRYWARITNMPTALYQNTIDSWKYVLQRKKPSEMRIVVFPFTKFEDVKSILDNFERDMLPLIVLRAYRSVNWLRLPSTTPEHLFNVAKQTASYIGTSVIARLKWKSGTAVVSPSTITWMRT